MNTSTLTQKSRIHDLSSFGVVELDKMDLKETNGGAAPLVGAAAIAAGVGIVAGALVVGVAVGVGIYYGVKWLTS